jgi:glucose-1-phosphate adenylyltransferase
MNDTRIGPGAVVDRAIVDKEVVIGEGALVGFGDDNTRNGALPQVLNTGITLVGKRAQVPANAVLGRNVVIGHGVTAGDFPSGDIPSGTSI